MRIRWIALFLFCGLIAAWWRDNSFEADLTLAVSALLWGIRGLGGEIRAVRDAIDREKMTIQGIDVVYTLNPAWKRPDQSQEPTSDIYLGEAAARERTRSEAA